MKQVALVVHPERDAARELAVRATSWWKARDWEVVEISWNEERHGANGAIGESAFAISLGGDGNMLRTMQLFLEVGVPVLGVNLGKLGYLTQVEPDGIEDAFERLISGEFSIEERLVLQVTTEDAERAPDQYLALNEVSVEKTTPGHTAHLGVSIADRPFITYLADGLVVATPTGSTAYNLSLRGPIISPELRVMVLTPVAPHMAFDRSLVLAPERPVRLAVLDGRPAVLVVDGVIVRSMQPGAAVTVRSSDHVARVVDFGLVRFHDILRSKFGLSDR